MKRRLSLTREYVAELTATELEAVVAAALPTERCTGYYQSINARCPTLDCFTGTTGTS